MLANFEAAPPEEMTSVPKNIEIKAVDRDPGRTRVVAAELARSDGRVLHQEDVFFPVGAGRLKLRILSDTCGELIFYDRPDTAEPKPSEYVIYETQHPLKLRHLLGTALGETVVVKKTRHVYLVGQTRIHLDDVEGLGSFLELEVVLRPGQDPSEGRAIAQELMEALGVTARDLVPCAYADLLLEKAADCGMT
jgi:predicted adenylyl cyclase CyaB